MTDPILSTMAIKDERDTFWEDTHDAMPPRYLIGIADPELIHDDLADDGQPVCHWPGMYGDTEMIADDGEPVAEWEGMYA